MRHPAPAMPTRPDLPPTRALVWLYTPVAQREAFAALCGIEAEIAASLKPGLDHEVAHARLAWWGEECARSEQGSPTHPLTRALGAHFPAGELTALAGLSGFVDTARWDLAAAAFETRTHLRAYCDRWADAMITPLLRLAGMTPAGTKFGAALRELELLTNLPDDARVGRLRVALSDLAAAGALAEALARPPWPQGLAGLLRTRHQELRAELAAGVAGLPRQEQPALRGLLVWARLAAVQSQRGERALPRALKPRDHHRPLDSWRAWSAARSAAAGRFALIGGLGV
jgi:15-cis-phytoene synthase